MQRKPSLSDASGAASNPLMGGNTPRYLQLARTLLNEIESGKYPVGSQLPTEFQLCEQFGVSRATVREAVKKLVQMGLVTRQPRLGTTVRAVQGSSSYRLVAAGVSSLYQYAQDTTLVIESSELAQVDEARATLLEGAAGETWLHLTGRRHSKALEDPICLTELWVHPAFRSLQGVMGPLTCAVHASIEQQFGEVICAVEQEIQATLLSSQDAQTLNAQAGSAALWISRKYRNKHDQLVQMAVSLHPASRFSYSTVLRREWGREGESDA